MRKLVFAIAFGLATPVMADNDNEEIKKISDIVGGCAKLKVWVEAIGEDIEPLHDDILEQVSNRVTIARLDADRWGGVSIYAAAETNGVAYTVSSKIVVSGHFSTQLTRSFQFITAFSSSGFGTYKDGNAQYVVQSLMKDVDRVLATYVRAVCQD